jgi:hypothetical protein
MYVRLTTIGLSRYPAWQATSQRRTPSIARTLNASMNSNARAPKHLDTRPQRLFPRRPPRAPSANRSRFPEGPAARAGANRSRFREGPVVRAGRNEALSVGAGGVV